MEDRIVSPYERFMTTVVDNIEHTESQMVAGRADHQSILSARARMFTWRSRRSRPFLKP